MPLPVSTASTPWPPPDIAPYVKDQGAWAAWWSGDTTKLADTTQGGGTTGRRSFWARRKNGQDSTRATAQLHATLAADIASTSADLLFGEPPSLLIPDVGLARSYERRAAGQKGEGELSPWPDSGLTTTETVQAQDRLDELADTIGLANRLLEGGEVCAATGGVYLRPMWDKLAFDHPLLTVVDADRAVPDFRYGQLVAVTFVEEVHRDTGAVWRHLERHEPGVILHGLYVGTDGTLGREVSLTDHPATRGFMPTVEVDPFITGGRPGIMPRFVPNVLPNRKHRKYPIGRSDYAGCESFLDALDETWTSWMRDLRLGQARLVVPDEFLTPVGGRPGSERQIGGGYGTAGGAGSARGFDVDSELMTGLNIADIEKLTDPIRQVQFAIRVEEHERTAVALTEHIISTAGYSPQTFGLHIEGRAESGTALRIREGKSWRTQGRKQRYWAPELSAAAETLLALDRVIFGRPTPIARPAIGWAELADDPQGTAQWVNTLATARAASIETRVRLAQPGLDDDQIAQEVERIKAEDGMGLPDPLADPGLGHDLSGSDPAEIKAQADAMGVLIRAGVEPADAARRVGLPGVEFTGAVPVSLRLPTADASGLEQA